MTVPDRSMADMLAEAASLLRVLALDLGVDIPDAPTDLQRVVMLARSIRFGWRQDGTS